MINSKIIMLKTKLDAKLGKAIKKENLALLEVFFKKMAM